MLICSLLCLYPGSAQVLPCDLSLFKHKLFPSNLQILISLFRIVCCIKTRLEGKHPPENSPVHAHACSDRRAPFHAGGPPHLSAQTESDLSKCSGFLLGPDNLIIRFI